MATTNRRARKTTAAPATDSDAAAVAPAAPDAAPDTDTAATDSTATENTAATPDTEATVDTVDTTPPEAPVSAVPVSGAPVSGAPVSGAPVGSADHMKIVMVAGVLGDHPDGVAAATVADESGLRAAIVGRVLAAMEVAGAAARTPAADGSDGELWVRGDGDLTTVDLANAETYHECSCGHRHRVRTAVGTRRASATPGTNSDGQKKLRKGDLRAIVLEFINSRPGHVFTAYDIAREINRSPGAVINNIEYFLREGLVAYADADGKKVTALATTSGD